MVFRVGHVPVQTGKYCATDPITDMGQILAIKIALLNKPRDLALFTVAINCALRAGDLLDLRLADLDELPDGRYVFKLIEQKTQKRKRVTLNAPTSLILRHHLAESQPREYLFEGQRGKLTVATLGNLVKGWCRDAGVRGRIATHSLRKTFVRMQIVHYGTKLPVLMKVLNHSSEAQTLVYCGLMAEDIEQAYSNAI